MDICRRIRDGFYLLVIASFIMLPLNATSVLTSHPIDISSSTTASYSPNSEDFDYKEILEEIQYAHEIPTLGKSPQEVTTSIIPSRDSECTSAFNQKYTNIFYHNILPKRSALVIRQVTAKHPKTSNSRRFGQITQTHKAVIKVQDLHSYKAQYTNLKGGHIEISEVAVGVIINDLIKQVNPTLVPYSGPEKDKTQASRYVGFVRTLDFMYCSLTPVLSSLKHVDGEKPENALKKQAYLEEWVEENEVIRKPGRNPNSLYIVLEQLSGLTAGRTVLQKESFCLRHTYYSNPSLYINTFKIHEHRREISFNFDHLRSFLIQILSTLWYGAEVDFTHRDLHMENIVSTFATNTNDDDIWHFDFVLSDDNDICISDDHSDDSIISNLSQPYDATSFDNSQLEQNMPSKKYAYSTGNVKRPMESTSSWTNSRHQQLSAFPNGGYLDKDDHGTIGQVQGLLGFLIRKIGNKNKPPEFQPEFTFHQHDTPASEDLPTKSTCDENIILKFRIPASATKHALYKIIDFGRSRAKDFKSGSTYCALAKSYNPFVDIRLLAYEILKKIPEKMLRTPLDENLKHIFPEKFRNEVLEQYRELEDVLKHLLGWEEMDVACKKIIYDTAISDLGISLQVAKKHAWLQIMSTALNNRKEENPKEELNAVSQVLLQEWVFSEKSAAKDSNILDVKKRFMKKIHQILQNPFFRKFLKED